MQEGENRRSMRFQAFEQIVGGGLFGSPALSGHRPDLRQLKVMLAALNPLGVLVWADVVAGNTADNGLYVPMITRLRATLPPTGLLYIGDCKMGALATRAYVAQTENFYRMPLAQVDDLPDQLRLWVDDAVRGKVSLHPVRDAAGKRVWGKRLNTPAADR